MAKLNDERMKNAFLTHLHEGETLQHWAFGVKQPSMLIIIPLIALAVLPGVIATAMLTKNYVIGVTDRRLIILQVKSISNADLKAITEYDLEEFSKAPANVKTGALFTHITIDHPDKAFKAKFHRAFSKTNREQVVAIGALISSPSAGAIEKS